MIIVWMIENAYFFVLEIKKNGSYSEVHSLDIA